MDRFVVMGVSGCGKSVIGAGAAKALGAEYIDGDDLHPDANIEKMAKGIPLDDADREPWLDKVGTTLGQAQGLTLIGCSALKRIYRDRIRDRAQAPVTFLHLSGPKTLIASRMGQRTGHFMPTALLDSQFAALEQPAPDEAAASIDIDQPTDSVIAAMVAAIESSRA